MKSLEILHSLLEEASESLNASTKRDWITIQSRFEHEGLEFLTLTLPKFSQWFESSMENSQAGSSIYHLFKRKAGGKSVLPCFLHGLTSKVFEPQSGLRNYCNEDVNAVYFIRQICKFHSKLKLPASTVRTEKAIKAFVETDLSLRKSSFPRGNAKWDVQIVGQWLTPKLGYQYDLQCDTAVPKHGKGSTADKQWANAKYRTRGFYERWNNVFSWEELYGFSTVHQANTDWVSRRDEPPVKVITVPKTAKGPRVISMEPAAMQYAQGLVSTRLLKAFDQCWVGKQLNLNDQSVNRRLAVEGSRDFLWSTLDLSEASDRLSCKVVREIFAKTPRLRRHLFACRSQKALVGKDLIKLMKFASMGSALTFPVQSYCFYVIAVAAVFRVLYLKSLERKKGVSQFSIALKAAEKVFVYGDDIIVPTDCFETVTMYLEAYGLKVNRDKSFTKGLFRESCGADGYKGFLVTPVYLRHLEPKSLRDATELTSWVSMGNQFHKAGNWKTAEAIRAFVDTIYKFPIVAPGSSAVGWHHYTGAFQPDTWDERTMRWLVRSLVAQSSKYSDVLDGYDALLKTQLMLRPPEDKDHLLHSPQRFSLKLRRRMVTPY